MTNPEIIITVDSRETVHAATNDGARVDDALRLDTLDQGLIDIFRAWLRADKISDARELRVFGTLLYRVLFGERVAATFDRLRASLGPKERLRVQLSFQRSATDLAELPWELLYAPDLPGRRGFFLATDRALVLARYIPLETGLRTMHLDESPLRILVVISGQQDLDPIITEPTITAIEAAAEAITIKLDILEAPRVDRLLDTLERVNPHVLHFIGHGQVNESTGRAEIALLDDDEPQARWIPDQDFAEYFVNLRVTPRLVFLQQCESGANRLGANFAGLAPQLIRAGMQAVVGMQYPVTNRAASVFSQHFYGALARGEPVDNAVQIARWRITTSIPGANNSRVLGTPVLYMHSRSGIIRPPVATSGR